MKVEMIMNGTLKLIHIPENEMERVFLEQLSKKPDIETTYVEGKTIIADKSVENVLIISNK